MTLREWLKANGWAREVEMLEAREAAWRASCRAARRESDKRHAALWEQRFRDALDRMGLEAVLARALRGGPR